MSNQTYLYEGYVKLPNGRTEIMRVQAPNPYIAREMLRAYGECHAAREVRG